MLSQNISKYRKARKMSQEDLAVRVHVVRQTVSKWEKALSVPDADQLIALSSVLGVEVSELLGAEKVTSPDTDRIAEELERANAEIARYCEAERLRKEAGKIRGILLWLTVLAVVLSHAVGNELLALGLSSALLILALVILYRNMGLLSASERGPVPTGRLRAATIFDIAVIALVALSALLVKTGVLTPAEEQEKFYAAVLVSVIIIGIGILAPGLPFNRHTGLRLPWTVTNEGAWNVAHRVLGIISVPLGLAYMSLSFITDKMEALTMITVGVWIGVPGLISLLYVYRLTRG